MARREESVHLPRSPARRAPACAGSGAPGNLQRRRDPGDDVELDVSTVDEYVAGRCDRQGRDLLVDLRDRGPHSRGQGILAVRPGADLRPVLAALVERRPDLVWLICSAAEPPLPLSGRPASSALHVDAVVRLARRVGAQVLLVPAEDADIEVLG